MANARFRSSWWDGRDSNPHTRRYWILNPARLPVPPPSHVARHREGRGPAVAGGQSPSSSLWWSRRDSNPCHRLERPVSSPLDDGTPSRCRGEGPPGNPGMASAPATDCDWSGRPDSNRRHPPWQGGALPTELRPPIPLCRPPGRRRTSGRPLRAPAPGEAQIMDQVPGKANPRRGGLDLLERATGIEPASPAWKAGVLPLNYARAGTAQNTWKFLARKTAPGDIPISPKSARAARHRRPC